MGGYCHNIYHYTAHLYTNLCSCAVHGSLRRPLRGLGAFLFLARRIKVAQVGSGRAYTTRRRTRGREERDHVMTETQGARRRQRAICHVTDGGAGRDGAVFLSPCMVVEGARDRRLIKHDRSH